MNLHAVVGPIVSAINPSMNGTLQRSAGFTQDASFKQLPAYAAPQPITAQVQPLTYNDMRQLDGVNIAGEKKAMYLNGTMQSVVRATQKGGDLVTLQDGTLWLTVQVLEDFSVTAGWTKVAVVRQQP